MRRSRNIGPRLVAVFLLGLVLLNYPVLVLFARDATVAGIPLLYAYVFVAWVVIVALMAVVVERAQH
jgi:hypothetical protein